MIEVLECLCSDLEHVAVNAGVIGTIAEAFPDEEVSVYCEAAHGVHLRASLGDAHRDRIRWIEVAIPHRRAGIAARWSHEYRLLRRAVGSGVPRLRVLLSAHRSLLWALRLRRAFGGDRVPTQVVLHGEVSEVAGWRSRNPLRRLFDMRGTLTRCFGRGIQYLVLEDAIAEELRAEMPRIASGVAAVPHPILASEIGDPPAAVNSAIRVAFLGLATEAKGFAVFLEVAERTVRECPGRFEFHVVGSTPEGSAFSAQRALARQPAKEQLSRPDFLAGLRAAHYVCLPYQSHYDFAASGALLDAVANLRPVIALPTPVLTRMLLTHRIGYRCQSADEMVTMLRQLANDFPEQVYRAQVEAMAALRSDRLPRALAQPYRALTERFLHGL